MQYINIYICIYCLFNYIIYSYLMLLKTAHLWPPNIYIRQSEKCFLLLTVTTAVSDVQLPKKL